MEHEGSLGFPSGLLPSDFLLPRFQRIHPSLRPCVTFCIKLLFYGEELLTIHPTPKLEDHPLVEHLSTCSVYLQLPFISLLSAT